MKPIRKLLIANRGEIAVRIIHAAREMGIRTVAVFSEADRNAIHAALADESVCIGEPAPQSSYLDAEKIIQAAKETGADAIHPGYGFLAERASFSERCEKEGLVFVGPPAGAMRKLGSKIEAKTLAVENGVPITPGFFQPNASDEVLEKEAMKLGYPVVLKASAGGGGRGMRAVLDPADFRGELKIARDEALKSFGDEAMMVEKLVQRPRHIEVQVLADRHGTAAVIFERECSIQRRHQKLIEECPTPIPTFDFARSIWPAMRDAALRLVQASGYQNAGTVEFMVDESSGEFYFLEVNARLQVEHPVTEAIAGIDLVQWQLRIASGEALNLSNPLFNGDRSAIQGHAIEARIVAEDPARGFLPSAGKLLAWAEPRLTGIRVDTGYGPGSEVPRHYDSLLAKVIAHGETRADALRKLEAALLDFHILGVPTNIGFLLDVIRHPEFVAGRFDTGFLDREFKDWSPPKEIPTELGAILAAAGPHAQPPDSAREPTGAWALADGFRVTL